MSYCIAWISHGKDSLKMLDVIQTRGLQLDMVATTDVWATDTIRAELPPVLEAKDRIEEKLWQMYRINVDHFCARNKDGSKKTYEQMFYHVPVRRSQTVQVERETASGRARSSASQIYGIRGVNVSNGVPSRRMQGAVTGFPISVNRGTWCQQLKLCSWIHQGIPAGNGSYMVPETQTTGGSAPSPLSAPRGAKKEISWST